MRPDPRDAAEKYLGSVYRAAFSVCGNKEDAEDATQETFIKFIKSKREYESDEHVKAWLLRAALSCARDIGRSKARRRTMPLEEAADTPVFEDESDGELFKAVMTLNPKYREVIHLFYYEDYSIRQISKILKLSESNVKVRLMRGRSMLKATLGVSDDEMGEGEEKDGRT